MRNQTGAQFALCFFLLSAFLLTGCYTDASGRMVFGRRPVQPQGPSPDEIRDSKITMLENQVRSYQSEMDRISTSMATVSQRTDDAFESVNARGQDTLALNRQIDALQARIADLESRLALVPGVITKAVNEEHAAIVSDVKKLIAESDKRTNAAIHSAIRKSASSRSSASRSSAASGPIGEGSFYEHVVEKGQTVSEIAKAYNVSTAEIIRASGLKNASAIRIGQILYIPQKD